MSRFAVARVDVAPVDVPLRRRFGIAGGGQESVTNAVVTVTLASGVAGHGEAAPFPAFNGETRDDVLAAVVRARGALEGARADRVRDASARLGDACAASPAARAALEVALLDAFAREAGVRLDALYGGRETTLETDVTLPTGSVDEARDEATHLAAFRTLKIKVGGGDLDLDVRRVLAAANARPDATILLDANAGLDAAAALELLRALAARGVVPALFEQPVPADDLDGLARVARDGGVAVCADESVTTAADVPRLARAGAASVVNVKLMKSGPVEAEAIALTARAHGLDLMIGGMVEGRMAMGASACLAAGLGGFRYVDLDTPLFFAHDPFEGGYVYRGATLDLAPIADGHGATLRAAR